MAITTAPAAHADRPAASPAPAIRVEGLTKVWPNGRAAVDDLTFEAATGRVVGFIGPNGSGKTTTFRMLLGLIKPTRGTGTVLGEPISHPERYLKRVGALVETPGLYLNLTGEANLRYFARLGGWDERRIPELLELARIDADPRGKVGTYSLGNRQRLAIAAALLPDPDLLLLDEPGNGLDPLGIRDLRRFLRNLASAGKTVFLSSHLLGELELVCDDIVMIQQGRLLYEGALEDLLIAHSRLVAVAEDPAENDAIVEVAKKAGYKATHHSSKVWVDAPDEFAAELNRACMKAGITLVELGPRRKDLESLFIEMAEQQRQEGGV